MLDHFLLSGDVFENYIRCGSVKHDMDNVSDHEPLILPLEISIDRFASSSSCYMYRSAWSKALQEPNYQEF